MSRSFKVYELIQELAHYSAETAVIIDFQLAGDKAECPLCDREYETEDNYSGRLITIETTDRDRWRAVHLICKED